MSRVLVVKTGSTLPGIRERRGDFESFIVRGMGLSPERVDVADVSVGAELPEPDEPAGIVVTGSSAMVSAREPWSERTADWLAAAVGEGTPVLGICYGHQLLAHALGGRVGPNPLGREIGTVALRIFPEARGDALLGALPARTFAHATHVESVLELPPGAQRLAESDIDANQAFSAGARAWGVQFHPEFDTDVMRGYLEARREILRREGLDADALLAAVRESPDAASVLRRFAALLSV